MAIIISYNRSPYGLACAACTDLMIAPNWSEYVGENQVRHFWCCEDCGNRLETLVDRGWSSCRSRAGVLKAGLARRFYSR